MKRLRIAGLLCAALLVFVMSGAAQTKDDVVNAYNAGAKAYKATDFAGAIASFQQVIDLGTKVGADADSLRQKCEKIMPNLQLKLAVGVYQNKASSNADIIDAFQKAKELAVKYNDVRVVSMPSWELFRDQTKDYRNEVLPPAVAKRLAVEAAAPEGWHEWVGSEGEIMGMTLFGESGPYKDLFKHFGFTVENIVDKVKKMILLKS